MIDRTLVTELASKALEGTGMYLVEVSVSPENDIVVELDSDGDMDVDACAAVSRSIGEALDSDAEDFSLEVGSAGITAPLKLTRQYLKNVGNEVEVLTLDGRKLRGILAEASAEGDTDTAFVLRRTEKVKEAGARKPVLREVDITLKASDCKYVCPEIKF